MLNIRIYDPSDREKVEEICCHGDLPDVDKPLYVSKKVILKGEEIVGFAAIKIVAESTMFFDEHLEKRYKVIALRQLVEELRTELAKFGLDQCISFTDIPLNFMQHLGFIEYKAPTKVKLCVE